MAAREVDRRSSLSVYFTTCPFMHVRPFFIFREHSLSPCLFRVSRPHSFTSCFEVVFQLLALSLFATCAHQRPFITVRALAQRHIGPGQPRLLSGGMGSPSRRCVAFASPGRADLGATRRPSSALPRRDYSCGDRRE